MLGPYLWLSLGCGSVGDVLEGEMDGKSEPTNHYALPFIFSSQERDMSLEAPHLLSLHSSASSLVSLSTDLMGNPTRA